MWSTYAKPLIFLVIAFSCNMVARAQNMYGCPDVNGMNDELRQILLGIHNEYRMNMVSGQEPNACGAFPTCKNVYKLQWDCDLEDSAELRAEQCISSINPNDTVGELMYPHPGPIGSISKRSLIIKALDFFWNRREAPSDYRKQIAFGRNTKLGCVVHDCTQYGETFVVCHYEKNAYAKNAEGQDQEVCEPGPACDRNLTCTTYACSFCDTRVGMCFIGTDYALPCPATPAPTTPSTSTPSTTPAPCDDITKYIAIDAANNVTILTTAINDAYNKWNRSAKSNFDGYKKRVESIIWSTEFPTLDAKMDEIFAVLNGYAPLASAGYMQLRSVIIPDTEHGYQWYLPDLIECPRPTTPTTTTTTTPTTTTTTTTTTTVGGCPARPSLIAIDAASNSTVLTTAINNAFNTWSRSDKANFNAYKKRVEDIIYTNTEFPNAEAKLQAITDVLKGYAPDGSAQQQLVYAVQIASWGTIADFVACGTPASGK